MLKVSYLNVMVLVFFGSSAVAYADKEKASKDGQEVTPICKCVCHKASEGGGDHSGFSAKIWFKATSGTVCSVNNGSECDGETDGGLSFSGKIKDCVKVFKNK